MASHSPQRVRRPQAQQTNQGAILNHQRDSSPSPTLRDRERPRAIKALSMPMVPSITSFPPQPTQGSPGLPSSSNVLRRSSPIGQVTRLLPTPPHSNIPPFEHERRSSPSPGPQQNMTTTNGSSQHYPRSAPRAPATGFPNRLQNLDENWQMTPELLADIERADQQQAQFQASHPLMAYPPPRTESPSGVKAASVVRVAPERLSPNNNDNQQRGRREQILRESPSTRDRHPASPLGSSLEAALTPGKVSPVPPSTESHPPNYAAHYSTRESPPVIRRAPGTEQRINPSIASHTPPLQSMPARAPDRSLPVQEEDENAAHTRSEWQDNDTLVESPFHSSSPTPSSDLNPEGTAQRFEPNVHHEEDKKILDRDDDRPQYGNNSTEEEGGYTPRSPTTGLPEDNGPYYPGSGVPIRVPAPVPLRPKGRNGSGDQIMRGLESTLMDSKQSQPPPPTVTAPQPQPVQPQPQKFTEQRQPAPPAPAHPNLSQYYKYPTPQDHDYANQTIRDRNGRCPPQPQVYPDDFQNYGDDSASSYIQSYIQSRRPDAPVPPTPHSATAAPSPSPMMSDYAVPKTTGVPGISPPQRAAGSPYPFPFNHVRRNRQNQNSRLIANGLDPATITEQIARQWQVFAQNNQGNITDSTLSPSSTPFQGDLFDHWAYLHTNRMMRGLQDSASIQSSPSHQPVPLPMPPQFSSKKKVKSSHSRRESYSRKPPPRVESTQPRETTPELSSSGEETAGDNRGNPTPDIASCNGKTTPVIEIPIEIVDVDDTGEWVDEEDEDDFDDLIDLEYHPSFVRNVSKRRRKWEVGWENLIQAFQALDRQTDATMVLLASPSHSTKLHLLRSRSIRRQPILSSSASMNEIRASFSRLASQRRKTRPEKASLVDRLVVASSASGNDGSDGSSQSVEENLRRALDAALGSLGALGEVYEQREVRVLEELQRSREDRERVELLLRQVLGDKTPLSYQPLPLFSA